MRTMLWMHELLQTQKLPKAPKSWHTMKTLMRQTFIALRDTLKTDRAQSFPSKRLTKH